jgi:hypothetical protein
MGFVLLALLTAFATLVAAGAALLVRPSGRAELGVAASAFFFALLGAPVFLLGYTGHLTRGGLAATALLLDAGVFFAVARLRGAGFLGHLRASAGAARALARLPGDALSEAWRARSASFAAIAVAGLVIVAGFVLTVLVPFQSWDGFFYHEPIIGYAIQNHGFAYVPLPQIFTVESVNGYPRLGETISLWFCIFTDKTLVEIPPAIASPPLILVVFALARRFTDRVTAMACAAVLFFVPHVWHELCSSYIDTPLAFFALSAMYWATRPPRARVRDAWLAALGMAMVVATKGSGLLWVPPIALLAYGRLVPRLRARPLAVVATVLGGTAFVSGVAALTLVRNYLRFKNPVWPMTFEVKRLHISWQGIVTQEGLFPALPFKDVVKTFYEPPHGGMDDIMHRGYGTAVFFFVLPIAAVASALALFSLVASFVRRGRADPAAKNLVMLLFPAALSLATTPSIEQPRYNVHIVAVAVIACAWLFRARALRRLREGVTAVAVVLSLLQFAWLGDALPTTYAEVREKLADPFGPRAFSRNWYLDLLARQRWREIGPGDRVAYDEHLEFVGALWNWDFSNRVEFIPYTTSDDEYLARIEALDPKWVCVGAGSAALAAIQKTGKWSFVGRLSTPYDNVVFRRAKR